MATITRTSVRKAANAAGKDLVYNRSTGMYQIVQGFTASEGEIPARDEKGRLVLSESQLKKLLSYI